MRRFRFVLGLIAAAALAGTGPAFSITNGTPDGVNHPAVGFLLATNPGDICSGSHQLISYCSVTLIAPDLALTSGDCATTFSDALATGFIDQVWIIFDENPVAPSGSSYDCTKFIDVDETEIVTNPDYVANPSTGANLGVVRLVSPLAGVTPVQLPTENRLKKLSKKIGSLTAVATGATTNGTGGYNIFDARRRSWPAGTNPPVQGNTHSVTLAVGGSPEQACFGFSAEGGAVFIGDTNEVISLTRGTLGSVCPSSASLPRLDVLNARDFLDDYVAVP